MKHLLTFGKVNPILYNGKLISIQLRLDIKGYKSKTIIFKDSFLLLPHSLRTLCNSFKIDSVKGFFPFKLNNILYQGVLPELNFWSGISQQEYDNLRIKLI